MSPESVAAVTYHANNLRISVDSDLTMSWTRGAVEQDKWQPAEQHWHVSDAVLWIVYRTEPNAAPKTIIPDVGNGRMTSKTLMAALKARATGDPRSWPPMVGPVPTPGYPRDADEAPILAYRVRFVVRRWMKEERLDAVGLFAKASGDLEKYEADVLASNEQQALFSAARRGLNAAARNGLITVLARPSNTWERHESLTERVPVRPTVFDEHRGVDAFGSIRVGGESDFNFLRDAGPFFHDAIVIIDEVKRIWPPRDAECRSSIATDKKRRVRGLDFATGDAALVAIAMAGLEGSTFRNATDAARALAHRADGAGNEESKMKRLLGRIKKAIRTHSATEQN